MPSSNKDVLNLVDLVSFQAENSSDLRAYTFMKDGRDEAESYTFSQLDQHSRAIAVTLQKEAKVKKGDRVLHIYPPGVEFISGFLGALCAGVIAIPAPPPDPARLKRTLPRLKSIIEDAGAKAVLTTASMLESMSDSIREMDEFSDVVWIATDQVDLELADQWVKPKGIQPEDVAYLQYTSGSTSTPKGVMVTHKSVLAQCKVLKQGFAYDDQCVNVTWMPYFHDYGLIDGLIQPLYYGRPCYILSPLTFVRRPERWLEVITKVRGTHTQAPNFAYEICNEKISDEKLAELDLSSLVMASSGGEPIRASTFSRFMEKFSVCGLKPESVGGAYGLAEFTLVVAAKGKEGITPYCHSADEAYRNKRIEVVDPLTTQESFTTIVGSGNLIEGVDVAIVDVDTRKEVPNGYVGEIWAAGESNCIGYWNRPEESEETFRARLADDPDRGPFLRTGDLGFVLDGHLYVSGREKDLIIINGVNHYPQDIEWTVQESHEGFRTDHVIAFSVDHEQGEKLVVLAESEGKSHDWNELFREARKRISEVHEAELAEIVMIKRGTIHKTSSGKLQRRRAKQAFLDGDLDVWASWKADIPTEPELSKLDSTSNVIDSKPDVVHSKVDPIHSKSDVVHWLSQKLAAELHLSESDLSVKRPFAEFGLSSKAGVALVGDLEQWLGSDDLPPTLLWEYPTIEMLSEYLVSKGLLSDELNKESRIQNKDLGATLAGSTPSGKAFSKKGFDQNIEPVAIVGLSCRFPGASSPEEFWQNLISGTDSVGTYPDSRPGSVHFLQSAKGSNGEPSIRSGTSGGFIQDVDAFDAAHFNISPPEASMMDPQQRIILELVWEAFERGGMNPTSYSGSDTGVFIGISTQDYTEFQSADISNLNAYTGPGRALSIAANRISYSYNFQGPSMAVDTACSSSLVALHQAVRAIRQGECSLAVVGGVNLILSPKYSVALSRAEMLSPDGRCRTFDESANGYVRSEGAGIVLLKPLSIAKRDGDQILAVVRGSAVNQDGRSNGLTAPNGLAQQEVIRKALNSANLSPSQIEYVEAHGTGTPLGDPIEMRSIQTVYGKGRTNELVCKVGSVKSNIGHLEAAAGIAGLMKVVLSIREGMIPPTLHVKKVNGKIKLEGTPFSLPLLPESWNTVDRMASVSSFGFGGTNAHVVLSADPDQRGVEADKSTETKSRTASKSKQHKAKSKEIEGRSVAISEYLPFVLSASNPEALLDLVRLNRSFIQLQIQTGQTEVRDLCISSLFDRASLDHRFATIAGNLEELLEGLQAFEASQQHYSALDAFDHSDFATRKTVWVFTGQGAQYTGMGRELYDSQPVFKSTFDKLNAILEPILGVSLLDLLWNETYSTQLSSTRFTQPAIFALEVSLAKMILSWGLKPDCLVGYSVGEYAAACIAGVFSLEDGAKLIAERGRLVEELALEGEMVAVKSNLATLETIVAPYPGLSIAAQNGAAGVVIAGDPKELGKAIKQLESEGIETRKLDVSHAFHSPCMVPVQEEFSKVAQSVRYQHAVIPVLSHLSVDDLPETMANAEYWVRHLTEPIRFEEVTKRLIDQRVHGCVEVGPKPTLMGMMSQMIPESHSVQWIPLLKENQNADRMLAVALVELYQSGFDLNWQEIYAGDRFARGMRKAQLPVYPFRKTRFWIAAAKESQISINGQQKEAISRGGLNSTGLNSVSLIGSPSRSPFSEEITFEQLYSTHTHPFYVDHEVFGEVIVPAAGHLSLLMDASAILYPGKPVRFSDAIFPQPLVLSEKTRSVKLYLSEERPSGERQFLLRSSELVDTSSLSTQSTPKEVVHSSGGVSILQPEEPSFTKAEKDKLDSVKASCNQEVIDDFYSQSWQQEIVLGHSFRWVSSVLKGDNEVLAALQIPERMDSVRWTHLHPGLMDSALQIQTVLLELADSEAVIPFSVKEFHFHGIQGDHVSSAWSHIRLHKLTENGALTDVTVWQESEGGEVSAILEIIGLQVVRVQKEVLLRNNEPKTEELYTEKWRTLDLSDASFAPILAENPFYYPHEGYSGNGKSVKWAILADPKENTIQFFIATEFEHSGFDFEWIQDGGALTRDVSGVIVGNWLDLADETRSEELESRFTATLDLVKECSSRSIPIVFLTCGAFVLDKDGSVRHSRAYQQALWGFARVIRNEMPELSLILHDISADYAENNQGASYFSLFQKIPIESSMQAQGLAVPGLEKAPIQPSSGVGSGEKTSSINRESGYLITGALGELGMVLAEWLVDQGAGTIWMWSRRTPDEGTQSKMDAWQAKGTQVVLQQVDVSDSKQVSDAWKKIQKERTPLKGVFHLAGLLDDGPAQQQTWERISNVLAPKVEGLKVLESVIGDIKLDHFVVFSSLSPLVGSAGQLSYAFANGFMDGRMQHRFAKGKKALSVNWGPLKTGMATRVESDLKKRGYRVESVDEFKRKFSVILNMDTEARIVPLQIDWSLFQRHHVMIQPLFSQFYSVTSEPTTVRGLKGRIDQADGTLKMAILETGIRELIAQALGLPAKGANLSPRKRLFDAGLDSLGAVNLKNQIASALGADLRSTLIFDYPTLEALLEVLAAELFGKTSSANSASTSYANSDDELVDFDELTEDDLAELLSKELEKE